MTPHHRIVHLVVLSTALVLAAATVGHSQQSSRPPAETPAVDVVATTLRARLPDGTTIEGRALTGAVLNIAVGGRALRVRIASVEPDASDPRGEVLLYDFRVQTPAGEQPLCAPNPEGRQLGLPIAGRSDAAGFLTPDSGHFELVCTAGPQGKCVRFGYGAWRTAPDGRPLLDWYNACVRMLRGDYCGDDRPFTRDGTWIDLYDTAGVQKSDEDPTLTFEAGWGPEGAVCVARPRLPDLVTLDGLARACPRLKDRVGGMCTEDRARSLGAVLFNRSRP